MSNLLNEFKLVEGVFSAEEAKTVLLELVDDKIKHHGLKNFAHEERFGVRNERSVKRIKELQVMRLNISTLLEKMIHEGKELEINSTIVIKQKNKKEEQVKVNEL